jgi:hypothetical protein
MPNKKTIKQHRIKKDLLAIFTVGILYSYFFPIKVPRDKLLKIIFINQIPVQ